MKPGLSAIAHVLIALLALPAVQAATTVTFDQTLGRLSRGDARTRAAFVAAAVDALSAQHEAAMRDARAAVDAPDPAWLAATRRYVDGLAAARAAALAGTPVRFLRHRDGALRILVGRAPVRQFMLTPPRPGDRGRLELDVLARFCDATGCGERASPAPARADGTPAFARRSGPPPAPLVAIGRNDGLHCPGDDVRHRRLVERLCAPLLAELRAIAIALSERGGAIAWDALALAPGGDGREALRVSIAGETLAVAAPTLAAAPEALRAAVPWIRAVLAGKVRAHAVAPPARLVYQHRLAAGSTPR